MSGASEVQRRGGGLPHVEHPRRRAAAGVVARRGLARLRPEPGVGVHRQRLHRLAGRGQSLDVAGEGPGHEDLVGLPVVAEDLAPRCRTCAAMPRPQGAQLGPQPVGVLRPGGRPARPAPATPRRLGGGRPVPAVAQHADLVLDLDHDHRVVGVDRGQVAHQGRRTRAGPPPRSVGGEHREHRLAACRRVGEGGPGARVTTARGTGAWSARTQRGAYVDAAFLKAPNQISTSRRPVPRACGDLGVDEAEVERALGRLDQAPSSRCRSPWRPAWRPAGPTPPACVAGCSGSSCAAGPPTAGEAHRR